MELFLCPNPTNPFVIIFKPHGGYIYKNCKIGRCAEWVKSKVNAVVFGVHLKTSPYPVCASCGLRLSTVGNIISPPILLIFLVFLIINISGLIVKLENSALP